MSAHQAAADMWARKAAMSHPPQVSTQNVERGEVWIRSKTGKEVHVPANITAAPGHEILVLWGNISGSGSGNYLYWSNISSQNHNLLSGAKIKDLLYARGEIVLSMFLIYGGWAALFVSAIVFLPHVDPRDADRSTLFGVGLLAFFLGWSPGLFISNMITPSIDERLNQLQAALFKLSQRTDVSFDG